MRELLKRLLGEFSWTPPAWPHDASRRISTTFARAAADPARYRRQATAAAAALAALFWLKHRQANLPQLQTLTANVSSPAATKVEENPKPEPVRIDFSASTARLDLVGKRLARGVAMTPPHLGDWTWTTDRELTFTPRQDWSVGQTYKVHLDRSLFADHVRPQSYDYEFHSAPLTGQITSSEFYIDPKNPNLKQALVTAAFSHPIDPASIGRLITLRMAGQSRGFLGIGAKSIPFTLSFNKLKNEAYIRSANIDIPEKDETLEVELRDGTLPLKGGPPSLSKSNAQITIPGLYSFLRIDSISLALARNARYEPEQVLVVKTSAGVLESEMRRNLAAYLLPKDLPSVQGRPAVKNYFWGDTTIIGPEILALSEPINLDPIPTDRQYAVLHSFKFKGAPGRFVYVRIKKGLPSLGGYLLAQDADAAAVIPEFPKELNIMEDGAILSLSGEKKLSIVSRGIPTLRFEVGRVLPGQINHLVSQSQGELKNPSFNYNFNSDNISEKFEKIRHLDPAEPGKTQYCAFDLSDYLAPEGEEGRRRGLFFLKVQSWDPVRKRPTGAEDKRLILVTDLGLIVKEPRDLSRDVFVASIRTGEPLAGVLVEAIGKNGLPVLSVPTDDGGRAHFPRMADFKNEREPVAFVARRGADLSFIPFDWADRRLNLSRFDVGGAVTPAGGAGLDAYLFSDRGVYRPGDEMRIGLIVKGADWRQSLEGVPLETVITDSRGLEVYKKRIALSAGAFEELRYRPDKTAPTGTYQASVYIVKDGSRRGLLGTVTARVEEFLPDRLKISTRLSSEREEGWVSPEGLKGRVTLKNLFGTPAQNRRIAAAVTLSPAYPAFSAYRDYVFFDPMHAKHSFTDQLPDGKTDANGEAELKLNLERFEKATYRLVFSAEGYEAQGGRGVGAESSALVSSLDYLVGFKPDGDLHYIHKASTRAVELVAVGPDLRKLAVSGLAVQVIERRYVSALTQQGNGTYKYESVLKEIPISEEKLAVPAEGLRYKLLTGEPGDFVVVIKDQDGTEYNRIAYSVVGRANLTRSLEKNAELELKLDKADYEPGREIELEIKAPYAGAGLLTIEKDKVYAHKWFKTRTTSSVERIRVPASLEGNGYVNVSFMRSLDSPEIFMSPLSYGVAPFSVSRARHANPVTLESPALARPGEPYVIHYKTEKPGRIVVFAVDEGILQVAGYATPDPLAHFFEKRALEVGTSQILDLILPEFKLVQSLSSPGGDQGRRALGKNLNPFRRKREAPVACWSGVRETSEEGGVFECRVPDYFNGTLRVMAVAVSPDSIGVGEKKALIRGPFVLSPNVPTVVAPGDEFTVSVGLSNNVAGSGARASVALNLAASGHLEFLDGSSRALTIAEGREGEASFRLRAKPALGSAELTFTARLGDQASRYSAALSVRPSVPYMTRIAAGRMKSGRIDIPVSRRLYPAYRTLEASASPAPLGLAHGLLRYLDRYPYPCTEQLISQAFPALILREKPEFGFSPKRTEAAMNGAFQLLRARQNQEGAFGFWAANSHASPFQAVYALHFLTEAKDAGYPIPQDVLSRGLGYLTDLMNRPAGSLAELRVRAYALYILTRNGLVTTGFLNGLRSQLDSQFPKTWKQDLAGAYVAATYKLLKQDMQADFVLGGAKLGEPQAPDYEDFYDGAVHDAQLLYLMARHFPERLEEIEGDDLMALAKPVMEGTYNSLSASYIILALSAYSDAVGEPKAGSLAFYALAGKGQPQALPASGKLFAKVQLPPQAKAVRIESQGAQTLFYQETEAGFDQDQPRETIKNKLEVQREYRDANGKVLSQIALGDEAEVHLKARAIEEGGCHHVAIVDLLPGGFEAIPPQGKASSAAFSRSGEQGTDEDESTAAPPSTSNLGWQPDYVDFREDRVVLYGYVGPSVQEYVYRIKATNRGVFAVPPAFGESMYDRTVQARSLGSKIAVQ